MYPQAISHGNILTFTPPGFHQVLNVKFPDSRLAVCEKCKKNYKTRDMCRVRNSHTSAPWATAFICVTVDDTCLEDGKFIDKPLTVRMVQWQPFCVRKPFDIHHPVCSSCKKTNRTRAFCRERHKHRQLPWCTVYVLLSALESTDPSTVVADPSKPAAEAKEESEEDDDGKETSDKEAGSKPAAKEPEAPKTGEASAEKANENGEPVGVIDSNFEETDDINDIAESHTFLVKVSCHGMSVHWLDLAELDPQDSTFGFAPPLDVLRGANASGTGIPPGDLAQYNPYAMGYAAQQQQLKTHHQYFYQMQRQAQQNYAQQAWPPPIYGQQITAGEAAAQQQKQQEGDQWQMMYPPNNNMYHPQSDGHGGADMGGNDMEPAPVDGDEGHDAKRVRMV